MAITERQREIYDTVEAARSSGVDDPYGYAADKLGITRDGLRGQYSVARRALVKSGEVSNIVEMPTAPNGYRVKKLSVLDRGDDETVLRWTQYAADDKLNIADLIASATERLTDSITTRTKVITSQTSAYDNPDRMTIYPIGDLHLGMMASAADSGGDWNTDKAITVMKHAFNRLVDSAPPTERCLIINLGDWHHINDHSNMTPASKHLLDVDKRPVEVVEAGEYLMEYVIDRALEKHKRADVWIVPGNHDPMAGLYLAIAIKRRYANYTHVTVPVNDQPSFAMLWGQQLIAATHGHKVKLKDLYGIMTYDHKKLWGQSKKGWWYVGHLHHDRRTEYNGMIAEVCQAVATGDAWAWGQGYRSGSSLRAITMHKYAGEQERITIDIEYELSQIASEWEDVA